MNKIFIFLIVSLILYLFLKDSKELFNPNVEKEYAITLEKKPKKFNDIKCCQVTRKMTEDGEWYYDYKKQKGDICKPSDLENIIIDNKKEYFYWKNDNLCSINNFDIEGEPFLGSCRNSYNSCFDFISKERCSEIEDQGYFWNKKTCMESVKYPNKISSNDDFIDYEDLEN